MEVLSMREEIQLSLGELEAIKRRMAAALQLADHPECALTVYFIDLAAVQLLSLLEQRGPSCPDRTDDSPQFWWQSSQANGKLKH
jgi:hypothetical protein